MAWRATHEAHEHWKERRTRENAALRCKPRRPTSKPNVDLSIAKYAARLRAAVLDDFRGITRRSCLSVYRVPPFTPAAAVPTAVDAGHIPPEVGVLWDALVSRGITPHGVVCHKSTWTLDTHGRRKTRKFSYAVPRGYGRVFVGRELKMQHNAPHAMAYGTRDHVYVKETGGHGQSVGRERGTKRRVAPRCAGTGGRKKPRRRKRSTTATTNMRPRAQSVASTATDEPLTEDEMEAANLM